MIVPNQLLLNKHFEREREYGNGQIGVAKSHSEMGHSVPSLRCDKRASIGSAGICWSATLSLDVIGEQGDFSLGNSAMRNMWASAWKEE
jgi:hypothetical protein